MRRSITMLLVLILVAWPVAIDSFQTPVHPSFLSPLSHSIKLCKSSLSSSSLSTVKSSRLFMAAESRSSSGSSGKANNNASGGDGATEPVYLMMLETSQTLQRISWLSWWAQSILTVVSSITLLFARNVVRSSSNQGGGEGLLVAGTGLVLSFLSIVWTWGGARLAQRLIRKRLTKINAAQMIRRAISVGVSINLAGMALALIGAEQIVGTLAVKVLTTATSAQGNFVMASASSAALLQPLDILVVQGNTNTLLSHFSSLTSLLYLTKLVKRLDPPSVEGDERTRK